MHDPSSTPGRTLPTLLSPGEDPGDLCCTLRKIAMHCGHGLESGGNHLSPKGRINLLEDKLHVYPVRNGSRFPSEG